MIRLTKTLLKTWLCLGLVFPAACTALGPDYERPQTFAQSAPSYDVRISGKNKDSSQSMTKWWETLGDPLINSYVESLLQNNLALEEAMARIEQAWERRNIERGGQYPALAASGSAGRSFHPAENLEDVLGPAAAALAGGSTGPSRIYDTSLEPSLNVSWQTDLFGRLRKRAAAANARYQASKAEREALMHSLIAEAVRRQINMSSLEEQLKWTGKIESNRLQKLVILEGRYKEGRQGSTVTDIYDARQELSLASADTLEFQRRLSEEMYLFDLLLGRPSGQKQKISKIFRAGPPLQPPPPGLPAYLLDRRPDLRAAELRLKAETEEIGVALADLYPDLSLTGSLGFESESAGNLFQSERMFGNLVGKIAARIFEGGRLRAAVRLEEAQVKEMAAKYAREVLGAMQEVQIALSNEEKLSQKIDKLGTNLKAMKQAEHVSEQRYKRGIASSLEVLDSKQRHYNAELAVIAALREKWNARIDLYLALGGDWLGEDFSRNSRVLTNWVQDEK